MTPRRWPPAAGIATALTIASLLAAIAVDRTADGERRRRSEDAARLSAERIVAIVEGDIASMERVAAHGGDAVTFRRAAPASLSRHRDLRAVALATGDADRLVVKAVLPNDAGILSAGTDLAADGRLDVVLDRAILEADAAAGAPFELDGVPVLTVIAPVVAAPFSGEAGLRESVIGAVVGAVDVGTLLGAGSDAGGLELIAPDGRAVGEPTSDDALETPVDIRGRTWLLRTEVSDDGWPAPAIATLAGGLAVTAVVSALHAGQVNRRRRAEAQASSRSQQLERIADAGSRLQQSLDPAELLPAFAVALASDFDLQSVSIELIDDEGVLTEAFATGDRGAPAGHDHTGIAMIDLPLRRGWRAVGVLAVRPGRALDAAELVSLQALADLLAVAMSNAQLYEREQLNAARLRELDTLKNAFLGTVSHELRTSMTAIMGFGELLADAWDNLDDDRRREMANRIRRSAGSLRHLVDDLLDFARLEQERLRVAPRNVDLAGIVRQTIEGLAPLLGHHELDLRVATEVPGWADPVAVERILANLVSNAAKYSPTGTTVTIVVESVDGAARLVVSDQGPGIPPEERRRIFTRFYRLDTPESVRSRGAGIGLAILRDFADRSGAQVHVDDAPGGGARFTVDFPIEPLTTPGDPELVAAQ